MENPSLIDQIKSEYIKIDQIKSKYIIKNIFSFIASNVVRYGLTFGKKSLLYVSKPALAAIPRELADELNISNWPKYSETIYATVKFMANKICDDYAKKLNNGYDKFPEDLREWLDSYEKANMYHDLLEKDGAEYFNREARPYISAIIICLLLIEIIDLGCKKKLFDIKTLNEYLAKYPKEKSKNINRWFNSLIFRVIYNALGESLKDKENKKSVLNQNINGMLCAMTVECIVSDRFRDYYYKQDKDFYISGWLSGKLSSVNVNYDSQYRSQYRRSFIANSYFWYIKTMLEEIPEDRKSAYNRVAWDVNTFIWSNGRKRTVAECFTNIGIDIDSELYKLIICLFNKGGIPEKIKPRYSQSKPRPKQEQIDGKQK